MITLIGGTVRTPVNYDKTQPPLTPTHFSGQPHPAAAAISARFACNFAQ